MPAPVAAQTESRSHHRSSVILVFCCTLIGATAQLLIKSGSAHTGKGGFVGTLLAILTHPPLLLGYFLYAVNTALMVLALRKGDLSMLYPIIALTFVWVTILSVMMFHDELNPYKVIGLIAIVSGVSVLGRGRKA